MTIRELCGTYRADIIVRRWSGAWVDFIAVFVLCAAIGPLMHSFPEGLVLAVVVGVTTSYHVVLEGSVGITLGKWLSGVRVVVANGDAPGFYRAFLRTLLRLLEVNPLLFGGVPAGLVADFSKTRQRIGDFLADTYVVKLSDLRVHFPSCRGARLWGPTAGFLEWGIKK